jgi:hypothetical protein
MHACAGAGQLDFGQVMSMFRDELLDLNAILDYIRLPPGEDSATASTVRVHALPVIGTLYRGTRAAALRMQLLALGEAL